MLLPPTLPALTLPHSVVKKEEMDLNLFPFLGREGRD